MTNLAKEIHTITIEDELQQSYLDYAMSVIVGRALPDARDGLKPVHRRVLFAMSELSNHWNKPYKKSARIVGDVIGKYHPHGDTAVYDTIVRMAQTFSLRYPLIDGQGNFGSVDGDAAAAMRYTEIRMAKIAHSLLADLDKETVDFVPNYDGTELAPAVLPSRIPNLIVNGSSGIAVGMATNIPPHNLTETLNACIAMLENPDMSIEDLMEYIPGPDFPTAGLINGRAGIIQAYKTGRGRIYVRGKAHTETNSSSGRESIIITELPYQVNKAKLIEKIAELVKLKKIESISALRDESDKDGMRIVVELKRGEVSEIVLNNLYTHTQLQVVFGINVVALSENQPKTLNLYQLIDEFLRHRREVVTRRTIYELNKAKQRAHILEGLGIALANIDEVIALIKRSPNPQEAKHQLLIREWTPGAVTSLLEKAGSIDSRPDDIDPGYGFVNSHYKLSPQQAQAILDLRLHRLTGLEQEKINEEYLELLHQIQYLYEILANPEELKKVIRTEFEEMIQQFDSPRRTEIIASQQDLTVEDLITEEERVVTLSHTGYVKTQSLSDYSAQRRGGKGKSATNIKDEDFVATLLIANTHDTIMCFSNKGQLYWLKVYQLPHASRQSRGKPFVNLIPLDEDEKINAILPVRDFQQQAYVFMATQLGTVKKVKLQDFSRPRASGIRAIEFAENDQLVGVELTDGKQDVMLFTSAGKAIRFSENSVRAMGRSARGVRGIRLVNDQKVISLITVAPHGEILCATENGYGKRTSVEEFRVIGRGGNGVIAIQTSERNGAMIGAIQAREQDEMMLITDQGTMVRTRVSEVSTVGRNAQGVRLIRLSESERLVGLEKISEIVTEEAESIA